MEPKVAFVTPVYKRLGLTAVCLQQRAEMLAALPFEAQAVVVGDDRETLDLARDLGMIVVKHGNKKGVGRKFNAGYKAGAKWGATHLMPVGSDSWLHASAFEDAEFKERGALGMIGLTSVHPWGEERIDLQIKYPAGFGVGMIYPTWAIQQGGGARPEANKGIDTSTWSRCGRGKLKIEFLRHRPTTYTNFHSPDTQITDYKAVRNVHRCIVHWDPWPGLVEMYGEENVRRVQTVYALASLGVFLTGERPDWRAHQRAQMINRNYPGNKGRDRRLDGSVRPRPRPHVPHPTGGVTYTEISDNFRALTTE